MKAIILAAGMGTRLGKYTENLPKCMLNFLGKSLIERQVENLRACGVTDITIVTGYKNEKINIPEVKYRHNEKYSETNMVESLFCARPELTGEVLIVYSDIICNKKTIQSALDSRADIGVTVDEDYWEYWQNRLDRPEEDIESLVIDSNDKIIELGFSCKRHKALARYIGLIKLSAQGTEILKKIYDENREKYYGSSGQWLGSKSFKLGYMTSLLQAVINSGHSVAPIRIKRGWLEFDTESDYERAIVWAINGNLKKFITID